MLKKSSNYRQTRGPKKAVEFSFKIAAYSPATFPMARLGEYIAQLGKLLGEPSQVHFEKLVQGSTRVVHKVQWEAVPKIRQSLSDVKFGNASAATFNAFKELNSMLRADNANACYEEVGKKSVILNFPGIDEKEVEPILVKQRGSLTGYVTRVGGADNTAHVQLSIDGRRIGNLVTTRALAKRLASALYDPVRVHGEGKWKRDGEGAWQVEQFTIDDFDLLDSAVLQDALKSVQSVGLTWDEGAFEELDKLKDEKFH
jgi:hypothetical protein